MTRERALVCDVAEIARRMPMFPVERTFELARLAALRAQVQPRVAWSVLFLKAYALVAAGCPELRRAYVPWPWPHFIEWPTSVGMLAVNRTGSGGDRVCWAAFPRLEARSLIDLNEKLRWYQTAALEEAYRKQVQLSGLPRALRRLVWWWNLNFAGPKRASRLGTFGLSSLASEQALNRGHPTPLTTSLTYGPLDASGRSVVTLLCDHRVLDGVLAARALAELETVLRGEICDELQSLGEQRKAA